MNKQVKTLLLGLMMLILLGGCAGPATEAPQTEMESEQAQEPSGEDRLVIALDYSDISSLDPVVPDDNSAIWSVLNIYDQMFRVTPDGKSVEPDMVTDYTVSDDGLTYTFNLRNGVLFSDGSPVTPEDVVFSMQRMIVSENWGFLFPEDTVVEQEGDNSVVFRLSSPYAPLINNLAGFWSSIVPKKLVEEQGDSFWEAPIASGPFMVKEWVIGDHLTLSKNPNYWETGKPYLTEVELRPGSDDNTRVLKLQAGELDILLLVPYNQIDPLDAMDGITATTSTLYGMHRIYINGKFPPLDDLNVRLALNYATDKQAINDAIMYGYATNANTILAQVSYWNEDQLGFPFDLEKAREYLSMSTVPDGFEISVSYTTGDTVTEQELILLQQQWAQIGVTLKLEPLDHALLVENFGSGLIALNAGYWSTSDVIDPAETISIVRCARTEPRQGFCDEELDLLYANALTEMDNTKREQLYFRLQERADEIAYWIPLFYFPNRLAYWDYVKDFNVSPTGSIRLWEVKIEK